MVEQHEQLKTHYAELHEKASDIVSGNQMLNEQCKSSSRQIKSLESELEDLKLKFDRTVVSNSYLNTERVNLEVISRAKFLTP